MESPPRSAPCRLRLGRLVGLGALLATIACGEEDPAPGPAQPAEAVAAPEPHDVEFGRWRKFRTQRFDPSLSPEQREMIEALEALGYARGSREAPAGGGIAVHDADRASPGLNFYTSGHAQVAILMDMQGRELHRWQGDFWTTWPDYPTERDHDMTEFFRRAQVAENGDLLAIYEGLGIVKLDRDSVLVWAQSNRAHHDLDIGPDGRVHLLTREARLAPRYHADKPILEDFVVVLDPDDGAELQRVSLLEAFEGTRFEPLIDEVRGRHGDLFHTNSIQVLRGHAAGSDPAFAVGNVLTYMLATGVTAVVDLESGKVVWARRGTPRFGHDPKVLESGNLLVFDNQAGPGASAVLEYRALTDSLGWQYRSPERNAFYSATCGAAERLPNGNTLVTESDAGRAFEVTPEGERVWEFLNPHRAGENGEYIATLFELIRLPEGFGEGWLGGSGSTGSE